MTLDYKTALTITEDHEPVLQLDVQIDCNNFSRNFFNIRNDIFVIDKGGVEFSAIHNCDTVEEAFSHFIDMEENTMGANIHLDVVENDLDLDVPSKIIRKNYHK